MTINRNVPLSVMIDVVVKKSED